MPAPLMHDVVIIGGGPAGLHAATRLAGAGFHTAALEEHRNIGDPVHCTGVLSADAFDEFGLSRRPILNELTTARFWSPAGREVSYSGRRTEAVVVDRRRFDEELYDSAREAGAEITQGVRATAVRIASDGVTVSTASGDIRGRVCVLACGANYSIHRQVGLAMPRLFLNTAQVEVPAGKHGEVELHFGTQVAPKGFGWVVPVVRGDRPSARVGVMCGHDAPRFFDRLIDRINPRWEIDRGAVPKPRQKILPLAPIARTYGDRLLAIGDAAGLVKPTTGGGIYYSLLSADLAAEVLSKALKSGKLMASHLAGYERAWRDRLSAEFQAQLTLRHLADGMNDAEIEHLFELARTDGIMPIVRRTASFNKHRNLILALLKHPPVRQMLLRRLAF